MTTQIILTRSSRTTVLLLSDWIRNDGWITSGSVILSGCLHEDPSKPFKIYETVSGCICWKYIQLYLMQLLHSNMHQTEWSHQFVSHYWHFLGHFIKLKITIPKRKPHEDFLKWGYPFIAGWFIVMEIPSRNGWFRVPPFQEPPTFKKKNSLGDPDCQPSCWASHKFEQIWFKESCEMTTWSPHSYTHTHVTYVCIYIYVYIYISR